MHGKTHSRSGYGRRAAGFVLRTGSLIACDQLTKLLAYRGLRQSGKGSVSLIPGVLELRYLENRGAAFGILQGRGPVFSIFAILIATLAAWIFLKSPDGKRFRPLRISMAGLTAGAAGNLIDRMLRGYVIDFIYFSIIDFPVFNVADICITLSVALLLILLLFVYGEGDFAWLGRRKSGGMSRRNFREESPHEDRSGNEESQYDRNGKDV